MTSGKKLSRMRRNRNRKREQENKVSCQSKDKKQGHESIKKPGKWASEGAGHEVANTGLLFFLCLGSSPQMHGSGAALSLHRWIRCPSPDPRHRQSRSITQYPWTYLRMHSTYGKVRTRDHDASASTAKRDLQKVPCNPCSVSHRPLTLVMSAADVDSIRSSCLLFSSLQLPSSPFCSYVVVSCQVQYPHCVLVE